MCLILFAWQQHPDYPLIVIANRDEYYARPTQPAHWWDEDILAGRDLQAGGTWLGVSRSGRFAAVTNVREPDHAAGLKSRGALTRNFLASNESPEAYLQQLSQQDQEYSGFNLLVGSADELWFHSNRNHRYQSIKPGVYGISNGGFNEDWPKLRSGREALSGLMHRPLDQSQLMQILTDTDIATDFDLPSTGVPLEIERRLSSRFIRSPDYGTRACTLVTINTQNQLDFSEQNFTDAEQPGDHVVESLNLNTK